eukprot:COSAG05_NODE_13859_length_416_cov_0.779180_1_plen_73_part_10
MSSERTRLLGGNRRIFELLRKDPLAAAVAAGNANAAAGPNRALANGGRSDVGCGGDGVGVGWSDTVQLWLDNL